MGGIKVSDSGR